MRRRDDNPKNPPGLLPDPTGDPERAKLRRRAEREAQALESEAIDGEWPAQARRVLHELRVHQIELEMQNLELRSAQEQLEVSRARYFDLYDLAPVGYVSLSEAGMILEANLTAASLLGLPRGSLPRQPFSRFIFREDGDAYSLMIRNLSTTGSPQTCELRMRKQEDAHFWARLDAAAAQDPGGAACRRVVITDITERKRAQEESFARQKLESVGTLASGIAHDFNNLLGGMMAQAELALDECQAGLSPKKS